jgi:hypothetical protein
MEITVDEVGAPPIATGAIWLSRAQRAQQYQAIETVNEQER